MRQHEHQHQIPAASKYQHNIITTTSTLGSVEQWLYLKGNYYWRHPVFVYFHGYGRKGIYHDLSTSFLKVTFLIGWKCLKNLVLICLSTSHPKLDHWNMSCLSQKKWGSLTSCCVCACVFKIRDIWYIIYDDIWYTQNHNSTMDFGPHVSPILPSPLALAGFFWLTSAWRSARIFFSLKLLVERIHSGSHKNGETTWWHGMTQTYFIFTILWWFPKEFDLNSMFFSF